MSAIDSEYARMPPRDKLAAARLKARKDSPYFGAALLNLIPREMPGLGTLGVTEKMLLLWDPEAVNAWPLDELAGVLEHEVMHVLRDHHGRARRLGLVDEHGKATDPALSRVWNEAGDCEINDDLEKVRPSLFVGERAGLLPSTFGLDNGHLAETYFDELRKRGQQKQSQGHEPGEGGRVRAGRCGSCAGRPLPGEPKQGGRPGKGDGDGKGKPGGTGSGSAGDDEGRTQNEVERIRKQVAREIVDAAAKGRGNVPGGWVRWAEESLAPPKIRWQDKLARLARAAVAWKAGQVDLRRDRISRRQWGIGIGAGRPLVAALRAPVPKVALAIDTSGSMGKEELTTCLQEAAGVLAAVGATVTLCTCDAQVHGLTRARSIADVRAQLKGGGGTNFIPVFEAMNRAPGGRPDVLIFMTDGDGPAPAEPPAGMQVIWLLAGAHRRRPCKWGSIIEVE